MNSIYSLFTSIYNWIYPVQEKDITVEDYDNYISLITKCIEENNQIVLETIFNCDKFNFYKTKLINSSIEKQFLIDYSQNPMVNKSITELILNILS